MELQSGPVELQVIDSIAKFENLKHEIEDLLGQTDQTTPFQTFEWVLANLLTFENDGLHLLVFRQPSAALAGFLPLVFRRGRRYVRPARWLELATQPYADYGMATIRPAFEAPVADAFLKHLSANKTGWTGVHLEKVNPEDKFIAQLQILAPRQDFMTNARTTHHSRRVMKDTNTAAAESKSLDKATKKLSSRGPLDFRVYTEPAEIEARLGTFFQLHAERFSAKGLRSPLLDERQQAFYNNIVRLLAPPNGVWLSCLVCGDVPIAVRFSLLRKQTLHLYATCFANDFARFSPSMVQLRMLLHYAFSHGIEVVDFGVGESPHKEHFGETVQQELIEFELYNDRISQIESSMFHMAQRAGHNSQGLEKIGKLLRKVIPYEM